MKQRRWSDLPSLNVPKKPAPVNPPLFGSAVKGLQGHRDLRLNLARALPSSRTIHETIDKNDSSVQIFENIIRANPEALKERVNHLDVNELEPSPLARPFVQIALLDVLFVTVAIKKFEGVEKRREKAKRSLIDKRL